MLPSGLKSIPPPGFVRILHMGPTAQDFHAAFELGENDTTIAPVDGIGVSLASIKALKNQMDEQSQLILEQRKLIEQLSRRIDDLESGE